MISSTKGNGFSSLFKGVRNTPRGFNYKPLFYDEDKERLEKRKEVIEREMKKAEALGEDYRISKRPISFVNDARQSRRRASRLRLIRLGVILAVILMAGKVLLEYLGL